MAAGPRTPAPAPSLPPPEPGGPLAGGPPWRDDAGMDIQTVEAIVIGAGMAGATAAAHLAPRVRVALLEAEESAGYHATGRSAAIWIRNYGSPDARILTAASRGFFDAPPPGFAEAPLIHPRDVLHLAPPGQVAHLEAMIAGGADIRPLGLDAARAMVPALRPGYAVMAAIETDCFDLDVAAIHQGFLSQVRSLGGVLALRHRAGRIWRQAGAWHAEASGGTTFRAPCWSMPPAPGATRSRRWPASAPSACSRSAAPPASSTRATMIAPDGRWSATSTIAGTSAPRPAAS